MLGSWFASLLIGCPQCQVVPQQLHDKCRVLVRIFSNIIEFCNGILESSACHLASLIGVLQDLILEDREVQCKAQADGMRNCQVLLCNCLCFYIGQTGIL